MNAFLAIVVGRTPRRARCPRRGASRSSSGSSTRAAGSRRPGVRPYSSEAQLVMFAQLSASNPDGAAFVAALEPAAKAYEMSSALPGKAGIILAQLRAQPDEVDDDELIILSIFGLRVDARRLASCLGRAIAPLNGGGDKSRGARRPSSSSRTWAWAAAAAAAARGRTTWRARSRSACCCAPACRAVNSARKTSPRRKMDNKFKKKVVASYGLLL